MEVYRRGKVARPFLLTPKPAKSLFPSDSHMNHSQCTSPNQARFHCNRMSSLSVHRGQGDLKVISYRYKNIYDSQGRATPCSRASAYYDDIFSHLRLHETMKDRLSRTMQFTIHTYLLYVTIYEIRWVRLYC